MNHKPEPPPHSLSIDEFCKRYGFTKAWYFRLRNRGEGPVEVRIGERKVRITEASAAEWEAQHTRMPEADTQTNGRENMPSYNGPGKYDPECERVFVETSAECVAMIVIGGDRGAGFAVTGEARHIVRLPEMLEEIARVIRTQRGDA